MRNTSIYPLFTVRQTFSLSLINQSIKHKIQNSKFKTTSPYLIHKDTRRCLMIPILDSQSNPVIDSRIYTSCGVFKSMLKRTKPTVHHRHRAQQQQQQYLSHADVSDSESVTADDALPQVTGHRPTSIPSSTESINQ